MKRILPVLFILVCSFSALGQMVYPSNRTISTMEKNMLFNAFKRFTVTQEGTPKLDDSSQLFNGAFVATYTDTAPSDSDPVVITIENISAPHVQAGAWIGWSTRYWGATKFKIEVYNTYDSPAPNAPQNTWFTVADVSNYTQQDFMVPIPYSAPGKIRFTFYRGSGTNGRLGLSELFLLHPEGAFAYDNLLVKYDKNLNVVLGSSVNTPDSTRGDLAIYAKDASDNRASLKIGYDESNNLEIYRNRTAPDIYFKTNQANTGHMRFVTNNSNFTFNGGKVGIGTNTPNASLQFGNVLANRMLVLNEGVNNDHQFYGLGINSSMLRFQIAGTGGSYGFFAATSGSASTEVARITGTGRLGIGTSTPNAPLQFGNTEASRKIVLFETANNDHQFYGLGVNAFMFRFQLTNVGASYGFFAATSASTSTEVVRITGSGRLSIGSSSPSSLLHVAGNSGTAVVTLNRPVFASGGGIGGIGFSGGSSVSNRYLSSITSYYGTDSTQAYMSFKVGAPNENVYSLPERMRIDKDGNVGIGTFTSTNINAMPAGYKLAVGGSIIAEKIKVKKRVSEVWPDYVFSPEYKLPSLDEIEDFTKKNRHLPEIPSAKEVEKEGQDLGEMNRLLLKKVEELTLYMIEQNKSIIQQNKEIKILKSKIEQLEQK